MDSEAQANDWCQRAAKGDRDAASNLLHQFYQRIYAYLRRLSGNDMDAADLTQETFQRVWQSIARFQENSSVTTWMHRIAYCTWVDWVRSSKATRERNYRWWNTLPSDFPSPSGELETQEHLAQLWKHVDQLPTEQSAAIQLRYGQQLTLKDTAEIMNIPLSTLKVRIKDALETLRTRLQESGWESHDLNETFT